MTSGSTSENFNFLEPIILKYNQDDEVMCLNSDGKFMCFEDPHLTQDFNALAKLQNKQVRLQEFVEETVADFDENLLTNANFKSINRDSSFSNQRFNTISTDSGNETSESACKLRKYKHTQLNDTIAKRTRSKLTASTPSTNYNLLPHHISDSFKTNTSPVIKCKRIRHTKKQKNVQTNKTLSNISQPEKNCLNLQFDTSTNSELNETISDNKATCGSTDFNIDSNLIIVSKTAEKEIHGNSKFSTNLSSPLNKTVHNYRQLEEFIDLNKAIPSGESKPHKNTDFSTGVNSPLNKNHEQFEITQDLNKNVPDNKKETYENTQFGTNELLPFENSKQTEICATNSSKKEITIIDIMYQLEEFERMVHDFKTLVINELNTRDTKSKSPCNKEMDDVLSTPKNENKNVSHEEELFISEMENVFKQQFSKNDDYIHDEEETTFSTKMPKWKNTLNKYSG